MITASFMKGLLLETKFRDDTTHLTNTRSKTIKGVEIQDALLFTLNFEKKDSRRKTAVNVFVICINALVQIILFF